MNDAEKTNATKPITNNATTTAATTAPDVKTSAPPITNTATTTTNSSSSNNVPDQQRFDKPIPGSTLRCLDDPIFETDLNAPPTSNRPVATDELDKARDRFDRFWGGNADGNENV